MTAEKSPDPEQLIRQIEELRAELAAPNANAQSAASFILEHGMDIVVLLKDLCRRRTTDKTSIHNRILVEGYSEESSAAALSNALNKASAYFSEQYDISLNVLELSALPRGGFRALVEVNITPLTEKDRFKMAAQDVELKHIHEHEYRAQKKIEKERIRHLVFDHFAATTGSMNIDIPDYFMININDAMVLNHMIEKAFFHAGNEMPAPSPVPDSEQKPEPEKKPSQIMVRVMKPTPGGESH